MVFVYLSKTNFDRHGKLWEFNSGQDLHPTLLIPLSFASKRLMKAAYYEKKRCCCSLPKYTAVNKGFKIDIIVPSPHVFFSFLYNITSLSVSSFVCDYIVYDSQCVCFSWELNIQLSYPQYSFI